jgi:uncharacterized membrane protein
MKRLLEILLPVVFCAAVFITGFAAGMCVKVFMVRDAPVIHGGGELLLLLALPAAVYMGYRLGRRKNNKNS